MKVIKKISAAILIICLMFPCLTMVAFAADGRISFSDPETKVGDEFDVKCAARSTGGNMGSIEIKLTYDTEFLRFVSGDDVTDDGGGALTLSADGGSAEQIFMVKFQALKEGNTQVSISGATIADSNGAALTMDQGNSSIKIGEGDPSKIKEGSNLPAADDIQVDVNGQAYTLTDKFSDGDIPNGYERTTVNLDGQDRQMVTNANSGVTLGYLTGEDGKSAFYVYNSENATFSPYAEIAISDMSSIVLMSDTSKVNLPENYQEATLTLGDHEFPVWQDGSDEGFYILYATNSNGESDYYRYDPTENTYQRFSPDDGEDEDAVDTSTLMGKVQKFISDNIQKIVLFGGLGALLVLLILIILFVKLHNRNVELDEIYDEYGLNDQEEIPQPKKKEKKKEKEKKKPKSKRRDEDDFDYDDFGDDDFATDDIGFVTDEMDFGEDDKDFRTGGMDFETDEMEFSTEDMKFVTDDISFETEEMEFSTEDFGFTEDVSSTEEAGFETASLDLDDTPEDDMVVYGGVSRTEELTIDDLDDILNDDKKKDHSDSDDAFKVDFIDLD